MERGESSDQQARAHQQNDAQRHFDDHQQTAHFILAQAGTGA